MKILFKERKFKKVSGRSVLIFFAEILKEANIIQKVFSLILKNSKFLQKPLCNITLYIKDLKNNDVQNLGLPSEKEVDTIPKL